MGTVSQPSWFPLPREKPTPVHLITTATALRLGELFHLHAHVHLRSGFSSLLQSSFKSKEDFGEVLTSAMIILVTAESFYRDGKSFYMDVWHERAFLFRGTDFLQSSKSAFSATCASCLCFFGGKSSNTDFGGKGKSYLESSSRNSLNGRKWTNILLAVNVLVYVAQIATQGKLMIWGAKINSLIDRGQLWRLATSSFLHANIGHLMVNCYSLNSVGPVMENVTGTRRFLAVYITSAVASSAVSYWFCKAPAVGASGAIFGLVGSFAVFVLRHRSLVKGGKEDLQHIVQVISLNMIVGLLSKGIDNWGHLGGLLGGAAISWLLGPAWRYESRTNDGRSVFADRAPIYYLINRKRTTR